MENTVLRFEEPDLAAFDETLDAVVEELVRILPKRRPRVRVFLAQRLGCFQLKLNSIKVLISKKRV
jgi:hypothetical protein